MGKMNKAHLADFTVVDSMPFDILGPILRQETIASGRGIRDLRRLHRAYGLGRWYKRKGIAVVRLEDGLVFEAEVHWYEASGHGKKELKIKRLLR